VRARAALAAVLSIQIVMNATEAIAAVDSVQSAKQSGVVIGESFVKNCPIDAELTFNRSGFFQPLFQGEDGHIVIVAGKCPEMLKVNSLAALVFVLRPVPIMESSLSARRAITIPRLLIDMPAYENLSVPCWGTIVGERPVRPIPVRSLPVLP
jgi:hypothetical protein